MFSAQVDTEAVLPCEATHDPGATITYVWLRDGQPLGELEGLAYVGPGTGNLTLSPAGYQHEGVYQCVVETVYGDMQAPVVRSVDITLVVTGM